MPLRLVLQIKYSSQSSKIRLPPVSPKYSILPAHSETASHSYTRRRQRCRLHESILLVQPIRSPIREQQDSTTVGYILVHPIPHLFHDQLPKTFASVGRKNRHVDHQEEAATIAYHTAHADEGVWGGGSEDLDGKEGVGEAESHSLHGLWGKAGEGAERDVIGQARRGVDDGVVFHVCRGRCGVLWTADVSICISFWIRCSWQDVQQRGGPSSLWRDVGRARTA